MKHTVKDINIVHCDNSGGNKKLKQYHNTAVWTKPRWVTYGMEQGYTFFQGSDVVTVKYSYLSSALDTDIDTVVEKFISYALANERLHDIEFQPHKGKLLIHGRCNVDALCILFDFILNAGKDQILTLHWKLD